MKEMQEQVLARVLDFATFLVWCAAIVYVVFS